MVKHAGAQRWRCTHADDTVEVLLRDDGRGFEDGGHGLPDRHARAGGARARALDVDSAFGEGTTLRPHPGAPA